MVFLSRGFICFGSVRAGGSEASSRGKLSHLKLVRIAKDKPGRLTSKKLQEMADLVGEGGFDRKWSKTETPAAARAYYLRVLKPELGNNGYRAGREMKTICYALDQLAMGKVAQATDILTQRLKAVHMAHQDGNWNRADFNELVPPDQISMTSLAEQDMANKDFPVWVEAFYLIDVCVSGALGRGLGLVRFGGMEEQKLRAERNSSVKGSGKHKGDYWIPAWQPKGKKGGKGKGKGKKGAKDFAAAR